MKNYLLLFLLLFAAGCQNSANNDGRTEDSLVRPTASDTVDSDQYLSESDTTDTLAPIQCEKTLLAAIENFNVWKLDSGAIVFKAKMAIDADGSPRAYCPDNKGLDYTANAGKPGNWYGVVTDSRGEPVIQKANDPCPGCYVSPTTLYDKNFPKDNPLRYCNSEKVPFIVLPKKVLDSGHIRIGDFAFVYNSQNKRSCFAVFADGGPSGKLGEGSVYLAEQLGINSSPRSGGVSGGIIYVVFPHSGSGNGHLPEISEIDERASRELERLGGKSIIDCLNL